MQVDVKTFLCLKMNDFNKSNTLKKSRKNDKNSRFFQKLKKKNPENSNFPANSLPFSCRKNVEKTSPI